MKPKNLNKLNQLNNLIRKLETIPNPIYDINGNPLSIDQIKTVENYPHLRLVEVADIDGIVNAKRLAEAGLSPFWFSEQTLKFWNTKFLDECHAGIFPTTETNFEGRTFASIRAVSTDGDIVTVGEFFTLSTHQAKIKTNAIRKLLKDGWRIYDGNGKLFYLNKTATVGQLITAAREARDAKNNKTS